MNLLDLAQIPRPPLLKTALTHPSFGNGLKKYTEYERLEFLGDAVLDLIISKILYKQTTKTEGELTMMRSNLVNTKTLSDLAQKYSLEIESVCALTDSVYASTLEAVIAAVYLNSEPDAEKLVRFLFSDMLNQPHILDAKSKLLNYYMITHNKYPVYSYSNDNNMFTCTISDGETIGTATSTTKKQASILASQDALNKLKILI